MNWLQCHLIVKVWTNLITWYTKLNDNEDCFSLFFNLELFSIMNGLVLTVISQKKEGNHFDIKFIEQ